MLNAKGSIQVSFCKQIDLTIKEKRLTQTRNVAALSVDYVALSVQRLALCKRITNSTVFFIFQQNAQLG